MKLTKAIGGSLVIISFLFRLSNAAAEPPPSAAGIPARPPGVAFDNHSSVGRVISAVDDNDITTLPGNVHPLARPESDAGAADPAAPMERMTLSLRLRPDKQAELDRLLARQQDPVSVDFHRWLTPEEFGDRFGASQHDLSVVTRWLASHGLVVDEIAKGRTWFNFSGTVSAVESAFHTRIRKYLVNGKVHQANSTDPSVPRALAGLVAGVVTMHDFRKEPLNTGAREVPGQPEPNATFGSTHYLSPADFATIYDVNPLYGAGIDGSGVSIAVVGRTHPAASNWTTFRSVMALPPNPPRVVVNGTDPGDLGASEDREADLDVEWAGAVARNATVIFVTSKSTSAADGIDLSAQYVVNNNLAAVMSTSFGQCEAALNGKKILGTAANAFYSNLWAQAAAQGISSFVASGDYGVAGCPVFNSSGALVSWSTGVNGLASTPYNIAVGGTQFNDASGGYWNSTNGTGYSSAVSYIPEVAWNESGLVPGGSGPYATGGGVSAIYAKPSWQVAPGVPQDGRRDIPDVSLSASSHDGYLVFSQGNLRAVGGTSASSPSFAGLMALIVQKTGQRQGNANTRLYPLANAQYVAGGTAVFHDITAGNNSVPGVDGFSCTPGYDPVTGLGSVDATLLVNNWVVPPSQTFQLTVIKSGKGSGEVTPNAGMIDWNGNTGTASYLSGTVLTLTAAPRRGSVFAGWSGCYSVSGRHCNILLNSNTTVTARFVPDIMTIIDILLGR